jgi:hypothetical protein
MFMMERQLVVEVSVASKELQACALTQSIGNS